MDAAQHAVATDGRLHQVERWTVVAGKFYPSLTARKSWLDGSTGTGAASIARNDPAANL